MNNIDIAVKVLNSLYELNQITNTLETVGMYDGGTGKLSLGSVWNDLEHLYWELIELPEETDDFCHDWFIEQLCGFLDDSDEDDDVNAETLYIFTHNMIHVIKTGEYF